MGHANGVSILTGTTSRDFHKSIALCYLIKIAPNVQWRCPPLRGGYIPNLKKITSVIPEIRIYKQSNFNKTFFIFFSSFHTLCENRYNSRMHASIWLKFNAHIWDLKANTSIKFGVNLINLQEVMYKWFYS